MSDRNKKMGLAPSHKAPIKTGRSNPKLGGGNYPKVPKGGTKSKV